MGLSVFCSAYITRLVHNDEAMSERDHDAIDLSGHVDTRDEYPCLFQPFDRSHNTFSFPLYLPVLLIKRISRSIFTTDLQLRRDGTVGRGEKQVYVQTDTARKLIVPSS